jgi:hypothetical protein
MPGRDIVCIGDSAGGTKALIDFLGALPDAPAAIFVIVHTSPQGGGLLAEVLERGGTLWELEGGRVLRYRCHVGHGYTADSLLADQSDGLENALWGALRALEEHSMLRRRMAEHALTLGRQEVARDVEQQAKQTELRASTIRRLLQVERPAVERKQADQAADAGYAKRVVEPRPGTRTRKTNR